MTPLYKADGLSRIWRQHLTESLGDILFYYSNEIYMYHLFTTDAIHANKISIHLSILLLFISWAYAISKKLLSVENITIRNNSIKFGHVFKPQYILQAHHLDISLSKQELWTFGRAYKIQKTFYVSKHLFIIYHCVWICVCMCVCVSYVKWRIAKLGNVFHSSPGCQNVSE